MDRDEARRREEAVAWFAARRAGVMPADQQADYDLWRADPLNQAAQDAVHEKWGELSALKELDKIKRPRLVVSPVVAAIAAALVAVIGLGIAWEAIQSGRFIETSVGQQKTQSLPDGSIIALNVVSKVSYEISDEKRVVRLADGEAAFTVHHERDRPFTVLAGDYEVRAVGTAFNVRHRNDQIEIAVSDGEVAICSASGSRMGEVLMHVGSGQAISFPSKLIDQVALSQPRRVRPETIAEWRTRAVTYEDASVGEVVEDFNRYFARKLVIDDPNLRDKRVTVRLQVEDRDTALRSLAMMLDARVRSLENADHLEG